MLYMVYIKLDGNLTSNVATVFRWTKADIFIQNIKWYHVFVYFETAMQ